MRGRYHWSTFTEDGLAKALICYNQAVPHAPDYALAYTGIADYYNWLGVYAVLPFSDTSAAAKEAALKANALDDTLAEVYAALGFATIMHDFDCDLAERHNAIVMVDDSHAVGFVGEGGRGTHELHGVMGRVDIITGTLGKAMGGASGGYVAARAVVVDLLRQRARPYLFSNSLAPPITAASLRALDLIEGSASWSLVEGYRAEEDSLAELLPGPGAQASVYAFDLVERRAKRGVGMPDVEPRRVQRVGVVGQRHRVVTPPAERRAEPLAAGDRRPCLRHQPRGVQSQRLQARGLLVEEGVESCLHAGAESVMVPRAGHGQRLGRVVRIGVRTPSRT